MEVGVGAERIACAVVCACTAHSVVDRGVWGHLRKSLKFRSYDSTSDGIGETFGNWNITQTIHYMVVSRSPFPLESTFVFETLPQNCPLGTADLSAICLQDTKQEFIYRFVLRRSS